MPARIGKWGLIAVVVIGVLVLVWLQTERMNIGPDEARPSTSPLPSADAFPTSTSTEGLPVPERSVRESLPSASTKRVRVIAHCPHHEFDLPDVPIQESIVNESGEWTRSVRLQSGAPVPTLVGAESLDGVAVPLPEPEWSAIGHWIPDRRGAGPDSELVASLSVCLDLRLGRSVKIPGTVHSPPCARVGRKEAGSKARWFTALEADRLLLPCDGSDTPVPSFASIARADGTAFGIAAVAPQPGNQRIDQVTWNAVGSIRCLLGEAVVGRPCTVGWSRVDKPAGREDMPESTGSTTLRWLEPGAWNVTAYGPGLVPCTSTVTVIDGQLTDLELRLHTDAEQHRVECSIRMESGQPIDDHIQAQLTDLAHPDIAYEFDWSAERPDDRVLTRALDLGKSGKYRLELLVDPGIVFTCSPALIGAETSRVEFVGLDGKGFSHPYLKLVHEDGRPTTSGCYYRINARGSSYYTYGFLRPEGGGLPRLAESDDMSLALGSREREFDPFVLSGNMLSALRGGTKESPSPVRVTSPATTLMLRLMDSDEVGVSAVDVLLDTGTKLRSDAWGYVTIPVSERAASVKCLGYSFADGQDGQRSVLDLADLRAGDLEECEIRPVAVEQK